MLQTYIPDFIHKDLEDSLWSHVVTHQEYDESAPWGAEWPVDWDQAATYLSEFDYGDASNEDFTYDQLSTVFTGHATIVYVPFAGLYAVVPDCSGNISLYRCETEGLVDAAYEACPE